MNKWYARKNDWTVGTGVDAEIMLRKDRIMNQPRLPVSALIATIAASRSLMDYLSGLPGSQGSKNAVQEPR